MTTWIRFRLTFLAVVVVAALLTLVPSGEHTQPLGVMVDCANDRKLISPLIYGIAFNPLTELSQTSQFTIGATTRRWGGDWSSRFNWQQGNAWNPGYNWYWRNMSVLPSGNAWQRFFENNAKANMSSALTLPTMGWVAKDTTSYSFPVSSRGAQQAVAPDLLDAGNGVSLTGKLLLAPKPQVTSIETSPDSSAKWVTAISDEGWSKKSKLELVFLDNEPDLWNATHRDVHPTPSTYDEVLQRSIDYASAIRAANSTVKIAGPSSWGWWGYFYSAADAAAGFAAQPDRRAHGNVPFLEWYLSEIVKEETRTGTKLLDLLDVHYYPTAPGVFGNSDADNLDLQQARIRSTRSLWDSSYTEESWVNARVVLIPRMHAIIDRFRPGTGLSIGEYNFGGENDISGALAQAEALGRFGGGGVSAAFLWTHPAEKSEQYWGFRTFRNYDAQGSNFLEYSVPTTTVRDMSVFASTDAATNEQVVVLINKANKSRFAGTLKLKQCGDVKSVRTWNYGGGPLGFVEQARSVVNNDQVPLDVNPWSIQVLRFT